MKATGHFYPVLIGWVVLFLGISLPAKEIVFYSLPEEVVNARLEEQVSWRIPGRLWIPLNGTWELKNPQTFEPLGSVRLPGTFQNGKKLLFEKRFILKISPGSRCLLHLGEVSGRLEVRLNDSLLYKDQRNYLPVTLTLPPDLVNDGANVLQLEVSSQNRRSAQTPGFYPINFPQIDSGILKGMYLEIRPPFAVEGIDAHPQIATAGELTLSGNVSLTRPLPMGDAYRLTVAYFAGEALLQEKVFALAQQKGRSVALPAWPESGQPLWSPDQPQRFWMEVTLDSAGKVLDKVRRPLAARRLQQQQAQLLLNAAPVSIDGINYVYQNREGSQLFDEELVRQDLEDIRQRGFNAVRVILHPLPEPFYRICDEMGLLVFQDLPLIYWGKELSQRQAVVKQWREYRDYALALSRSYSSLVGIGLGYYLDGGAVQHRRWLGSLTRDLAGDSAVTRYVSTLLPDPALAEMVDFQIVEMLERHQPEQGFQHLQTALSQELFFPSAFSKALSYRADTTTITLDLLQVKELYQQFRSGSLSGQVKGQFVPTYSDYYLYLPSLQNGRQDNTYLNQVGLVDLKRHPYDLEELGEEAEAFPVVPRIGLIHEDRAAHSFWYILIGFLNVFLFLISYRRYRIFRQNLHYSISKPHGFFVSLQERIVIPSKQSFFVLLVIAVNGAIVYSSLAFFYRNHLIFDYILSLFFFRPAIKSLIVRLVWDQALFIVVGTIAIILAFYGLAIFVKLFSLIGRRRVLFNQALAVSIWAAAPFVLLLPLGIFMYSLLLMMKTYWILLGGLLYFHVWGYLRWINGTRVLTDRLYGRAFLVITLLFLLLAGSAAYLYESYFPVWDHLSFLYRLEAFWN